MSLPKRAPRQIEARLPRNRIQELDVFTYTLVLNNERRIPVTAAVADRERVTAHAEALAANIAFTEGAQFHSVAVVNVSARFEPAWEKERSAWKGRPKFE